MVGPEPGGGHDPVDDDRPGAVGDVHPTVATADDRVDGEAGDQLDRAGSTCSRSREPRAPRAGQGVVGLAAVGAGRDCPRGSPTPRCVSGTCPASSARDSRVFAAECPAPTTRVRRPAKRSRSAPRTSGRAWLDDTRRRRPRRGPGCRTRRGRSASSQVPDASITARASRSSPSARRTRNGVVSRPAVRTRSRPSAGDRHDPGAVADVRLEHGQVGQRLRGSRRRARPPVGRTLGVGPDPAGVGEQASGGGVDVVPPRGEQPHVSPLPDRGGRAVAGFQDRERQAALGEVGGGGEADRSGADDDDGQVSAWCWS